MGTRAGSWQPCCEQEASPRAKPAHGGGRARDMGVGPPLCTGPGQTLSCFLTGNHLQLEFTPPDTTAS